MAVTLQSSTGSVGPVPVLMACPQCHHGASVEPPSWVTGMVLGPCPQYLQHGVPTISSQEPSWIWHTVSVLGHHTAETVAPASPAQHLLCPQHLIDPAQRPQRPQHYVANISSCPQCPQNFILVAPLQRFYIGPQCPHWNLPKHPKTPRAAALQSEGLLRCELEAWCELDSRCELSVYVRAGGARCELGGVNADWKARCELGTTAPLRASCRAAGPLRRRPRARRPHCLLIGRLGACVTQAPPPRALCVRP